MLGLREVAGFSGSGYEPDIVMGFYKNGQEEQPLVIFGDAKRYKKSDIGGAYKETVGSTMVAYGHWAGLEIGKDPSLDAFVCPVKPFFTLFHVNNDSAKQRCNQPCEQRMQTGELPPVMAFSLEHMQQGDGEELCLWFSDIEEQVVTRLQ